jgi:hypothetical protein
MQNDDTLEIAQITEEEDGPLTIDTPGGNPSRADLNEPRSRDKVITSSGTAPTGGVPAGSTDRVIPDRSRWTSRTNDQTGDEE